MIYGIFDRSLDAVRYQPKIRNYSATATLDFAEIQKNIQERKLWEISNGINVNGDANLSIDEMKHTRTNTAYRYIKRQDQTESIGIVQGE